MKITKKMLQHAEALVGPITEEALQYVDCFVHEKLGIFIPSVGFCQYAIQPMHTHPGYSFVIFFHPENSLVPVEIEVPAHHFLGVAMSPHIEHEENTDDGFTRYIAIFIEKDFFEEQYSHYGDKPPTHYFWEQFIVGEEVMNIIKKFMAECEGESVGREAILNSYTMILTHEMIRGLNSEERVHVENVKPSIVENTISYMEQNFGEKLAISDLARFNNISESHLLRTFKEATGVSPIDYLIQLRIEKAQKLLRTGRKNITEVAYQCGFSSLAHFSTAFSKAMSITPSQYQKLYQAR